MSLKCLSSDEGKNSNVLIFVFYDVTCNPRIPTRMGEAIIHEMPSIVIRFQGQLSGRGCLVILNVTGLKLPFEA